MSENNENNYDPMAEDLDNLSLLDDESDVKEEQEEVQVVEHGKEDEFVEPDIDDPNWTEFVMKQFLPDEMFDGYPMVDGLRRVASKLLGDIILSRPRTVQSPNSGNGFHATVEWELGIMWRRDDEIGPHQRIFGDVADVSPNNTDEPYCLHAAACAATKAEGRALRKALMLTRIHTAEEMMDVPEDTGDGGKKVTDSTFTFLDMKGRHLNINIGKMLQRTMEKNEYKSARDIPYNKGVQMFHWINQIQCKTKNVPADLVGYDPEWKEKLGVAA